MRAWLAAPGPGGWSRWRWLGVVVACVGIALLWRPALAWLGVLPLLAAPRRVRGAEHAPDPAPPAQDAHRAASETVDALRHVAAEERAAGEQARDRAASDPIDEVVARIEGRAREPGRER